MKAGDASLRLDNQLCFKLYAASRLVTRAYQPMLTQLGLTYPQYLVMLVLWEWHQQPSEQPTVKALGARLLLDSGTLTPLLKRLQGQGLLERKRSSADEREVHLALSEAGWSLYAKALPLKHQLLCDRQVESQSLEGLRQQLDGVLAQLLSSQ
ncbi:MarR family transcriptional regulator [Ectopseudomonas mendocina]|uniref:MarR family transcriptional regulator n=1 Tax=Ectopseudomonas mendocina TaxID=300 RepID=A0ABZ2RML2_ECTME